MSNLPNRLAKLETQISDRGRKRRPLIQSFPTEEDYQAAIERGEVTAPKVYVGIDWERI